MVTQLYSITNSFPQEEVYGLTSQIRRAGVSIPSNIAEGHARSGSAEYLYFLSISRASLAELDTLIVIAESTGYLDENVSQELNEEITSISKQLNSLIAAIRKRKG